MGSAWPRCSARRPRRGSSAAPSSRAGECTSHTVEQAERSAERLAAVLGLASCDRASLERIPATELVAATEELGRRRPDPGNDPAAVPSGRRRRPPPRSIRWPRWPTAPSAGIDLLIGTNRDELTLFGLGNPALMALDEEGVQRWVANAVPDMPRGRRDRRLPIGAGRPRRVGRAQRHLGRHRNRHRLPLAQPSAGGGPRRHGGRALRLPLRLGVTGVRRDARAPVTPWSCPSCSGRCICRWCRSSPAGARPSRRSRSRCSERGWPSPPTGDPSHEGIGDWRPWDPIDRATMIFGADTGLRDGATRRGAGGPGAAPPPRVGRARARGSGRDEARAHPHEGGRLGQEWCDGGRSPTGRGRALKPSPVRVRIPPPPRREQDRPFPGRAPRRASRSRCSARSRSAARPGPSAARPRASWSCTWPSTGGVRHAEWSLAIWPERPVALATVHSTSSDARRALGRDVGRPPPSPPWRRPALGRLGHDRRRTLRVARRRRRTRTQLLRGHALVRGPLFAGLHRADWAVFDGTSRRSSRWSCAPRSAAPTRSSDAGSGSEAEWMVRQALQREPLRRAPLPRVARGHRRPGQPGPAALSHGRSCARWPGSLEAALHRRGGRPERAAVGLPPSRDDGPLP